MPDLQTIAAFITIGAGMTMLVTLCVIPSFMAPFRGMK